MNIHYIYVQSGVQHVYIFFERSEFRIPTWVTLLYRATSKKMYVRVVVITGGWCVAKKKEHTYRAHHLPWKKTKKEKKKKGEKKKKKKKKRGAEYRTREL